MSTAAPSLYEADETAWLEHTAALVAARRFTEVDADSLSEFLTDMAKRDKREVKNRLAVLLQHLLKWEFQPDRRTTSWELTIDHQRNELADMLDAGSLRRHAEQELPAAYSRAVRAAAKETGLAADAFPADCPYTVAALMAE